MQSEPYQQLAWWNLAVENAPDEPKWWARRGRFLANARHRGDFYSHEALRSYERAIALAPGDARLYEARAKIYHDPAWWVESPDGRGAAANYRAAMRLRIGAGQIEISAAVLRAQGDQQLQRAPGSSCVQPDYCYARAHAFYTLALEADPDDATLYLARIETLKASPLGELLGSLWPATSKYPTELEAAFEDYVRALALDQTLQVARTKIVAHLAQTSRRDTAHQQIEALLEARQTLLDAGIEAELASAIVGEVEAALAQ